MLPKSFRLKRSTLFPKTFAAGKTLCHSPYFLVLALPRLYDNKTPPRFGFVVSKKVSNRANQRNRVKRRLRELVRTRLIPNYLERAQPYIAIVFVARKGVLKASYSDLEQTLQACLENG